MSSSPRPTSFSHPGFSLPDILADGRRHPLLASKTHPGMGDGQDKGGANHSAEPDEDRGVEVGKEVSLGYIGIARRARHCRRVHLSVGVPQMTLNRIVNSLFRP